LKTLVFAAMILAALTTLAPNAPAQSPTPRQHILLDANWRFHLAQSVTLGHAVAVNAWRWKADDAGPTDAAQLAAPGFDASESDWQSTVPGEDDFHGRSGYDWFRTTLPQIAGPNRMLRLQADDNADVYLNGVKLMHHEGWNEVFDVPLDAVWMPGGPNVVAVLVQNTYGGGGLVGPITVGTKPPAFTDESQPGFNDRAWRVVHLPHDYVVEGKFTPTADASHGSLPTQPAWYRKTFTLPISDKGKDVWVTFDGIYRDAKIWINGDFLGEHKSGYIGVRYDISKAAHYGGVNTLAVHVDPTAQEGWWYEGGGIYRHVWLNVADPVHVAPWGTYVISMVKNPLGKTSATLTIQTTLDGMNGGVKERVLSQIYGPQGVLVGSDTSLVSGTNLTQHVSVPHARLWSLTQPSLYRLHTEVVENGKIVDAVDTPFGIRTIRFDPNTGFYLNERPVKVKGVCNHQDFAGVGIGVPDTLEYWRVAQLKKMGTNGWRMSHNPPTPSLLDACDREGMLVMDENRHLGDTYSAKSSLDTPYSDLSDLRSMILRDRNHPSIILWSMCNEEGIQSTPQGARIFQAMMNVVHQYDTTRPITCAMNGGYDSPVGITSVEDVQGVNYNPGAYAPFHQAHPQMPLFGSETASTVSTRGVYTWNVFHSDKDYTGVPTKGWVSAYDVNAPPWAQTAEAAWQPQANNAFVAGGFAWTGFDYKGEPTPFGWPDINSNFGILDEAGFPKDGFYYYKAWWTDTPVVHILPHWNWPGKEGQPIPVWVYSNAARVDLLLNGKDLGSQAMPLEGHLAWSVPYAPGTLVAKGYNASGKLIGSDRVATTGAPARLRLTTDRTTLAADGEDMTVVDVAVVDAQGRVVPTAGNQVTFRVTGAGHVAGVGNGDPSDHDPDQADYRRAFNGLCMVLVGAGTKSGAITLTATSPGLAPARLALKAH
jgi:beta-galactosidase